MRFLEAKEEEFELYEQIKKLNIEIDNISKKIDEIENSKQFKDWLDVICGHNSSQDDINNFKKYLDEIQYSKLQSELKKLKVEVEELQKKASDLYKKRMTDEENAKKEKSGLSDKEYFDKEAILEFGTTSNFNTAGYILQNGKMLDFSGGYGNRYGSRAEDHRAIGRIFSDPDITGSTAMLKYMSFGNIRIIPESPAINIPSNIEPTTQQYSQISKFISYCKRKGESEFYIDFTDTNNGQTVHSISYEDSVPSASIIMDDIYHFFK